MLFVIYKIIGENCFVGWLEMYVWYELIKLLLFDFISCIYNFIKNILCFVESKNCSVIFWIGSLFDCEKRW